MNTSAKIKEKIIQEYIMGIDFTNENYSIVEIKKGLKSLLHETPAVKIDYKKDRSIDEATKKVTIDDSLVSITIGFSDGEDSNGVPSIHTVKYFI